MSGFRFYPDTAVSIAAATSGLSLGLTGLTNLVMNLRAAGGCGTSPSGSSIEQSLRTLGDTADQMSDRLPKAVADYRASVTNVGGVNKPTRVREQGQNRKIGARTRADNIHSRSFGVLPGSIGPRVIPDGPSFIDQLQANTNTNVPDVPSAPGDSAGKFACSAGPEGVVRLTLDTCAAHLAPAVATRLTCLPSNGNNSEPTSPTQSLLSTE